MRLHDLLLNILKSETLQAVFQPIMDLKAGQLIGVRGTAVDEQGITVAETVFAPAHGKPLPAKEITTFPGQAGRDVSIISHWNEAIHVQVPARVIPIEALIGR